MRALLGENESAIGNVGSFVMIIVFDENQVR
jgi:hypothetical protein